MDFKTIPLNQLVQSPKNVRRTNIKEGIEGLAASIAEQGLRQNLNVEKVGDKYEVVAGQRRLLALQSLAKKKVIKADHAVPCAVLGEGDNAEAISLAENTMREAMHPDDQFEAFNKMVVAGKPIADVAANFGVTPTVVKQRMKLAAVSPKLRALFRKGELTLDQMMGFTVSDSHERQEEAWDKLKDSYNPDGDDIRRLLTADTTSSTDDLAKFVGVKAYEKAGGQVIRDLFDDENEGYLTDALLLNSLAQAKLEAEAEKVKAEGWSWVAVEIERDHDINYGRVWPQSDEPEDDEDDEEKPEVFSSEDMARAGAILTIGWDGKLAVMRGFIRPEDMPKGGKASQKSDKEKPEFSGNLIEELTSQRTAALRLALIGEPFLATIALVHSMALSAFYWGSGGKSCFNIRTSTADTARAVPNPEECPAQAKLQAMHDAWEKKLPEDDDKLWAWLLKQKHEVIQELAVFLIANTIDAIERKHGTSGAPTNVGHSAILADELGLNMADHWTPSVDGFISRLKKGEMVRALTETGMPDEAAHVQGMKKAAAITATARALDGTRWLPKTLQHAEGK